MYKYNIYKMADNNMFKETCKKIENGMSGLKAEAPLVDVDGTVIQIYEVGEKKIKVYNDYEVDAVYIDSEINLDQLFLQ